MSKHAFTKAAALYLGLTSAIAANAQDTDHNPVDECIEGHVAIMKTTAQSRAGALHERTLREQHNPYIRSYNSVTPENDYREFMEPVNGQGVKYMIDLDEVSSDTPGQKAYKLITVWYLPVDYDALANKCTFETGGEYLGRKYEWPPAIKGFYETEFTLD